jgi:hypothetical protein
MATFLSQNRPYNKNPGFQEDDDDLNNRADQTDPRFHWRTKSRTKNPEEKGHSGPGFSRQQNPHEDPPHEKEFKYKCHLLFKDMKSVLVPTGKKSTSRPANRAGTPNTYFKGSNLEDFQIS